MYLAYVTTYAGQLTDKTMLLLPKQVLYQFADPRGIEGLVDLGEKPVSTTCFLAQTTAGASSDCATACPRLL